MTFLDLYNLVIRSVYPEKVARSRSPIVKDWVRDALIDLQKKVPQLRAGNVEIINQAASYYTCGLSAVRAPRGWVKNVSIRHSDSADCPSTPGVVVSKNEMLAMRDGCPCSAYPKPLNQGVIGQYRLMVPDPSIDRINPLSYRYVSMFDGYIWWYPWFNSNEELMVEWEGEKKSWEDTDLIPESFLDERGTMDREVQMLIELYVTANKDVLASCKPRDVAFALYRDRLARYIISRIEQDKLDIEPPYTPVCKPYASPALSVVGAKWPAPTFSEQDVSRWDVPVITEEDYDSPVVQVALAPIISPSSTTFIGLIQVFITSGMVAPYEIRYTTNGSTPHSASPLYSGPITISGNATVKAILIKAGYQNSPVVQQTYTLVVPDVSPVVFSPSGGSFIGSASVIMTTATPGPYEIRYTTNGDEPADGPNTLYMGPVPISSTTTFKAIVVKPGYHTIASSVKTYTLVIPVVDPVEITPADPYFIDSASVGMSTPTPGATIRYTTNGSTPTPLSPVYTSPITVTADTTVKAKAFKSGYTDSTVATKVMVKMIPVEVSFDREEFMSVIWTEKSASIGSATSLTMVVEGTSCTFDVWYNGASLFGSLAMGPEGTHENTLTRSASLSGGASSIVIKGAGSSYFRLAGDTFGYTLFKFYVH